MHSQTTHAHCACIQPLIALIACSNQQHTHTPRARLQPPKQSKNHFTHRLQSAHPRKKIVQTPASKPQTIPKSFHFLASTSDNSVTGAFPAACLTESKSLKQHNVAPLTERLQASQLVILPCGFCQHIGASGTRTTPDDKQACSSVDSVVEHLPIVVKLAAAMGQKAPALFHASSPIANELKLVMLAHGRVFQNDHEKSINVWFGLKTNLSPLIVALSWPLQISSTNAIVATLLTATASPTKSMKTALKMALQNAK